jgi:hypothetical protein
MPTLVSAGVSVQIIDESFYIPAAAPTVPLIFIATNANKYQPDGLTPATFTQEHSVVRTMTSILQSTRAYGIPNFRTDNAGNGLHGDCRNEYGLFALNQYLTVGNVSYVVRADVDLSDSDVVSKIATNPTFSGTGNGVISNIQLNQQTVVTELWTITCQDPSTFTVSGYASGAAGTATVGSLYNNGKISFLINNGSVPFQAGDSFSINITTQTVSNPLGANDAAKRLTIVRALQAEINMNQDVRSEYYEYNLILCPGYHEVVDEMLNLSLYISEEAFVIADCPFDKTPEDTATWALTSERFHSQNVGYYYPHALASNLDGNDIFVAASGVALKTFAYSDSIAEIWYAPAGIRRGLVYGVSKVGYVTGTLGTATTFVECNLNQGQRDILYQFFANVNPIVFFPGRGIIIWGQKTSYSAASALDRINVVRLLMMIKRDIRKASFSYVFEPNDQITRDNIKAMIDGYLGDILIKRGLYDFVVLCDLSNNTPTRIDRNELYVDIALKPVKAIEFIYIPIRVLSTGAKMPG